jgi:hypothetical protein
VTPLTALLSHVLVAFTIEFDNTAETRMPHRTTRFGPTGRQPAGPWLISLAFWANCLRPLVAADAISTRDLERAAGTTLNLRPMTRWGYATVDAGKIVRPTDVGRRADAIWRDLLPEIEGRWRNRLGADRFGRLIAALRAVDAAVGAGLPDALPTLGFGLWRTPRNANARPIVRTGEPASDLTALLSRALLASAMAYEATSAVSLAIAANVLRLAAEPAALRTVPDAGISREAVVVAVTALDAGGFGHADTEGPKREPRLGLTERGQREREAYPGRLATIEVEWRSRIGDGPIDGLRAALSVPGSSDGSDPAPLQQAITPPPDVWRARTPRSDVLPDFPVVLHRGGYPDGA